MGNGQDEESGVSRRNDLNEMDNAVMDVLYEGADCISNIAIELRVLNRSVAASLRKLKRLGMVDSGLATRGYNGKVTTLYQLARTKKAA